MDGGSSEMSGLKYVVVPSSSGFRLAYAAASAVARSGMGGAKDIGGGRDVGTSDAFGDERSGFGGAWKRLARARSSGGGVKTAVLSSLFTAMNELTDKPPVKDKE